MGLTDDGDFLMSGINGGIDPPLLLAGPTPSPPGSVVPDDDFLAGLLLGPPTPPQDAAAASGAASASAAEATAFDPHEVAAEVVRAFVRALLPSPGATERDCDHYATILVSHVGFDPDCIESAHELQYGDLSFMKVLHRRIFWKEWKSLTDDHPAAPAAAEEEDEKR